jgi:hypothetical protein
VPNITKQFVVVSVSFQKLERDPELLVKRITIWGSGKTDFETDETI